MASSPTCMPQLDPLPVLSGQSQDLGEEREQLRGAEGLLEGWGH